MSLLLLLGAPTALGPYIIGGVDRLIDPGWEIHRASNYRTALRCSLLDEDGSSRPSLDDEVLITFPDDTDGGAGFPLLFGGGASTARVEFAGLIESLEEQGLQDVELPIVTTIQAVDYTALAERRYVSETIPAGTLKSHLDVIVAYLPGVTLDPAQVDGPAIEAQQWDRVQAKEVLDALATLAGGYVWHITDDKVLRMFQPGTIAAPFNIDATTAIANMRVTPTREGYANRIIVRTEAGREATAEDASAAANPWELIISAPESTPTPALQDIADAVLAMSLVVLKRVSYVTLEHGVRPGQTQVITRPARNLNNTFVVTDVVTRHRGGDFIEHTVTAVEGLVNRTGYRDTYKRWNTGSGRSVAGGFIGAGASARFAYFLGGSGQEFVSSPTPDWVPIAGGDAPGEGSVHVQINTVARGTTQALVTARLRARHPGVSVKMRLFDVTDGVACPGESLPVTSTDWQTVTFTATTTPGSHLYEAQLLPGAANELVAGVGYLE